LNAAMVASTKPDSFKRVGVNGHLHVVLVGDAQAAIDRGGRGAPVFVQLQADRAGRICSGKPGGQAVLPLPVKPKLSGTRPSPAASCAGKNAPGVQVVAQVPVAGPVPPPTIVVRPAAMASCACCGQIK
jgi:hypothetical protein